MERRTLLSVPALFVASLLATQFAMASPPDAKQDKLTTVTLEIDGMICSACVDTVEDAIKSVNGVTEADVSLNDSEAVITYDSSKCKVADLIDALDKAQGMNLYEARVKEKKKAK